MAVARRDELLHGCLQGGNARDAPSVDGLLLHLGEPLFGHVHPRRPRRHEVEAESPVSIEPPLDLIDLVRAQFVEHDPNGQIGRYLLVQNPQGPEELLVAVTWIEGVAHVTIESAQRRIQADLPMAPKSWGRPSGHVPAIGRTARVRSNDCTLGFSSSLKITARSGGFM